MTVDTLDQIPVFASLGASMLQGNRNCYRALPFAAICAIAMSGCAATTFPSQRLHEPEMSKIKGGPVQFGGPVQLGGHRHGMHASPACASCEDRQRLKDYAHRAMPYIGGPFMHGRVEPEYAAPQATIQPPHSKFHPVPTRPVFETRASYLPPQPMGVQLSPVPDQQWRLSEAMDTHEVEADAFLLSPPSN